MNRFNLSKYRLTIDPKCIIVCKTHKNMEEVLTTQTYVSKSFPEMNEFLRRLEIALQDLPGNPKPSCTGFYLSYFDKDKEFLSTEKIGFVSVEKDEKYWSFAIKKVIQTLYYKKTRSKDFENSDKEQYPGGIQLESGCAGVSGHDSLVDEAIALLWLIHCEFIRDCGLKNQFGTLLKHAYQLENTIAPDNTWIAFIAERMINA